MSTQQQFMDLMQRVRQLELDVSRGGRTIRDAAIPISRTGTEADVVESTNYCCNELECLKVEGVKPAYYLIQLTGFDCDCEGSSTEVRLYQVDPQDDTLYESDSIRCLAPQGMTIPCTVTSTWTWNNAASDWDFDHNDANGCNCTPVKPGFSGTTNGQIATTTCDATKVADGETDMAEFFWRLTIIETLDYFGCDATTLEFHIVDAP